MRISRRSLEEYLARVLGRDVEVRHFGLIGEAAEGDSIKGFGYGRPLLIEAVSGGRTRRLVLETMRPGPHGHEHMADRAHAMLRDYAAYNNLPRHVSAVDVGFFSRREGLRSAAAAEEFFVLTDFAAGRPYAEDLERIARSGRVQAPDAARCRALADYLAAIHETKKRSPALYRRALRELIGHGECIMGVVDSYPARAGFITSGLLAAIEHQCNRWRWRLRDRAGRLSQVHGDFHPWNVLFRKGTDFSVLDRARAEWGEPADDVTSMSINYLFASVRRHGDLRGPLERLFSLFWQRYLDRSGDEGVLEAAPPFFAFRGLVIASPLWYPDLPESTRRTIFDFIERVLDADTFDPARVAVWLSRSRR